MPERELLEPSWVVLEPLVLTALREDIGRGPDLTTDAVVPSDQRARARVIARCPGRVCGTGVAIAAFRALDPDIEAVVERPDGTDVGAGGTILTVGGRARAILTAERTALNFLARLSGIATATARLVETVAGHDVRIVCTRKTTPGLRVLEKYAVRCGGGFNHRFGLDDAVLIKDNHLIAAGSIRAAVERVRGAVGHTVFVEVEVDSLEQLDEALDAGVGGVLLDNMGPDLLAQAVRRVDGRALTEASGGITLDTVRAVAASGVDVISVGALTHSAAALDLSLELQST